MRDEELAGGHGDNLLRLEGDPGPVLGCEHAAVPGPVQAVGRPGHVRDTAEKKKNLLKYGFMQGIKVGVSSVCTTTKTTDTDLHWRATVLPSDTY